ncbi:MAG TPA: ABC transporter ATP-binding protein [Candidatus Obscuribacterales bacterium]
MNDPIVCLRQVHKAYGRSRVLNGLDMYVPEGSVYGLLGRNGAGKTTTLRMLMDLVRPGSGSLEVMGHAPAGLPMVLRQQIGYSSDSMQLIPWLSVAELLNYNGSFYPDWDPEYVKTWLQRLELQAGKRVFSLSRGDRQKLALIMAIGHRPRLLILDEPAGGLDPLARKEFLESIIELIHESGTTIVLSSHQMSDLERIADTIGLMVDGRMRLERSLEELKLRSRRVQILGASGAQAGIEGIVHQHLRGGLLELVLENWSAETEQKLLRHFPEARIESSPLSLEELFLVYTSKLAAGGAPCPAAL